MYERFTDRSRKVMQLANQEAQRFNHEYVGTEHLFLGLLKEGSGIAANVLRGFDYDLTSARKQIEKLCQCGPDRDTAVEILDSGAVSPQLSLHRRDHLLGGSGGTCEGV